MRAIGQRKKHAQSILKVNEMIVVIASYVLLSVCMTTGRKNEDQSPFIVSEGFTVFIIASVSLSKL